MPTFDRSTTGAHLLVRLRICVGQKRSPVRMDILKKVPPPRTDDAAVKQAIANVVKDRGTYGYRRVWAHLRLDGHDRVNQKRVYLVMRDKGWLMYRHGENLSTPESMKTKWQSKTAMCDGVQIALSCHATTVRKCGWHLRWTAATGKS